MAITYSLAPNPKWIIINDQGTVAGGAKMYTYRSLNKIEPKAIFQDAGGTIPWSNPVIFDLNGTQGPFYWEVDSANPNETYYIEIFDANGDLLWNEDGFLPGGGGGGGNVTTYIPLVNYIANNQFVDHIDDTVNPIGVTNLLIAASNHKGFTPAALNPIVGTYGVLGPDIRFTKNNTAATDQITFLLFPLASAPLIGDVTPVDYVRYQCTNTPAGETYKVFQFPICQKVKNLSNQVMTFTLWAAVTASPISINIYCRQYYGSGTGSTAESTSTRTLIGTCALTTTWTPFNLQFTVPNVAGNSIGTPGLQTDDDALYIQISMPLGAPCDILFTKPALYLGAIDPDLDFEDYDQIDSINSTPRTGDVKSSLYPITPPGDWLYMNNGTIGNVGSGATARASSNMFQLYKTIWDGVVNTWAPVSGGRGATALADFLAGKTLSLPQSMGRALAENGNGAGLTNRALGENGGSESQSIALNAANLPPHTHTYSYPLGGGGGFGFAGGTAIVPTTQNTGNGPGTSTPFVVPTIQPTTYMNFFIKR